MATGNTKATPQRWVKVAVDYYRNPKIITAGPCAELAYVRLLAIARERIEVGDIDGEVPLPLANRELRDVADLADTTVRELLEVLVTNELVTLTDDSVLIDDWDRWQTTRAEVETKREASRTRAATRRGTKPRRGGDPRPKAGKPDASTSGRRYTVTPGDIEESDTIHTEPIPESSNVEVVPPPPGDADEEGAQFEAGKDTQMGVYDTQVAPFTDLRAEKKLVAKTGHVAGKLGLDPKYADEVERVAEHILQVRKTTLGAGQRSRIGSTWRRNIQALLKGETSGGTSFTGDQLCDLFEYAAQDDFWRGPVCDPEGLARNAHKMWLQGRYVAWSLSNGRPEANRPTNVTPTRTPGVLAADKPHDSSGWDTF